MIRFIWALTGLATVLFQTVELRNYFNTKKKIRHAHLTIYLVCTFGSIAGTLGAGYSHVEKTKLKNRMNRLLNSLLKDIDELEVQLPKPKIPKKIREKKQSITQPIQIEEKFEEEIEQQDKIEQELLNVREKLKKLNG